MFFSTVSIGTLPAYKHAFVSMCPKKKIIENKIRNKNKTCQQDFLSSSHVSSILVSILNMKNIGLYL